MNQDATNTFMPDLTKQHEKNIKDFRIKIRIYNNNLISRREAMGLNQVETAKAIGMSVSHYGAFELMKVSPLTKRGTWRKGANQIAAFFQCVEEDIFPNAIQKIEMPNLKAMEKCFNVSEVFNFLENKKELSPYKLTERKKLRETIHKVLSTLTPREEYVMIKRMGLGCKPQKLEEIAKDFGVTREHVRKTEAIALRKLRHPSRARRLMSYVYED